MARKMAKYSKKIADKIIELKKTGNHTNKQICEAVRISQMTLKNWRDNIEEFADRWEEAETEHLDNLKDMALTGLASMLQSTTYEEKSVEYKAVKVVEIIEDVKTGTKVRTEKYEPIKASEKVTQKHIAPNPTAVIFTLTNRAPTQWKNKQDHNIKSEDNVSFFGFLKEVNQVDEEEETGHE